MNEVTLPWPPSALSPNARVHWAVRSRSAKQYRMACFVAMREAGIWSIPWDGEIHMWLDFYPPDRRQRDDDNIIAAFKSGRDGIADALKTNDARFRIHPYVKEQIGGMVKVRFTPGP
jgi:crossover junction endodeoxyribonuclease RusA